MLVPEHRYGHMNSNLQFVSFAQAHPKSTEFYGLDSFQIHFLTKEGHIYSLCPYMPQTIVLRDEHFSQILVLLNDKI